MEKTTCNNFNKIANYATYDLTCTVLLSLGGGSGAPVLTQANRITNSKHPITNSVTQEINPQSSVPDSTQGTFMNKIKLSNLTHELIATNR